MPDWLPKMFCVDPWGLDTYEKLLPGVLLLDTDARITYWACGFGSFPKRRMAKKHSLAPDHAKSVRITSTPPQYSSSQERAFCGTRAPRDSLIFAVAKDSLG
jgi:hypothetical protein